MERNHMKKSFFINGGAGRVLCAIPALEHYKENVDPDVVIVAEAWSELFLTSKKLRHNVWPMNSKGLWEQLKHSEIISPEPYRLNAYFNQKANLIQAFDMLINYDTPPSEVPDTKPIELDINKVDQIYGHNMINQIKQQTGKKKVVVFQPLGSGAKRDGDFIFDSSGRSFELRDVYRIVEELSKHYAIIMMTNIEIPTDKQMGAVIPNNTNMLQWMGIMNASDYFIGCDSMGQHYAHALGKPATVVIGATYPENISYPANKDFTIIDVGKEKREYMPYRVTIDWAKERDSEDLMIFEDSVFKQIIKSVTDKLGKEAQDTKTVPLLQNTSTSTQALPFGNNRKARRANKNK
jgi:hypothetical protein